MSLCFGLVSCRLCALKSANRVHLAVRRARARRTSGLEPRRISRGMAVFFFSIVFFNCWHDQLFVCLFFRAPVQIEFEKGVDALLGHNRKFPTHYKLSEYCLKPLPIFCSPPPLSFKIRRLFRGAACRSDDVGPARSLRCSQLGDAASARPGHLGQSWSTSKSPGAGRLACIGQVSNCVLERNIRHSSDVT